MPAIASRDIGTSAVIRRHAPAIANTRQRCIFLSQGIEACVTSSFLGHFTLKIFCGIEMDKMEHLSKFILD